MLFSDFNIESKYVAASPFQYGYSANVLPYELEEFLFIFLIKASGPV